MVGFEMISEYMLSFINYIIPLLKFQYVLSFAVIISIIGYIPQMLKLQKTKDSTSVSLWTYIMWTFVSFTFAVHAYFINDIYFLIAQGLQFFACVIIVILHYKYRNK